MSTFLSASQVLGRKNVQDTQGGRQLGDECLFPDVAIVNGQLVHGVSGHKLKCQLVKTTAILSPGNAVQFADNKYGTEVDAVTPDGSQIDGIIDPTLVGDLAVGDVFLLITGGPVDVIVASPVPNQAIMGAGAGKVKNAPSTSSARSGRLLEDGSAKSNNDTLHVFLGKGL